MSLKGKAAMITGAGRGIGFAIARRLAGMGASVCIVDLNQEDMHRAIEEVTALGARAIGIPCDVSDWEQVQKAVNETVEKFGKIDILVNNAGITKDNLIIRMTPEDWDKVLAVNLKGAFLFIKAVARVMMKNNYGKIVNITSVVGIFGNAGQANYSASKAGLIGLTKSVAKEFAKKGIRCNAVAPGFIETDMTKNLPEQAVKSFIDITPLGYPGKTDDVANVVAFLCSPESDYITGEVIRVDGGMAM